VITDIQLSWHKSTDGSRMAIDSTVDPSRVYQVLRTEDRRARGQWIARGWLGDSLGTDGVTELTDFETMKDAQSACQLGRRCISCERMMSLADLRVQDSGRRSYRSYICRARREDGTSECEKVQAKLAADREAEEREALKRKDHNHIEIREGQYGPDLVVGNVWLNELTGREDGSSTVLGLTEDDLARIERVIRERRQDQAAMLRWKRQGPDRRYLSEFGTDDLDKAVSVDIPLAGRYGWGDLDLVRVVSEDGTYFCGRVTYVSTAAERITVKLMGREQLPSKAE
jgi:hypothetical protein